VVEERQSVLVPTKAQHHAHYTAVPALLKRLREEAGLTQRQLGQRLRRPQSWVYNCETANRRVDVAEFVRWCRACDVQPAHAVRQLDL
jgi:transcriptional regulator with XRE-family HTH domain